MLNIDSLETGIVIDHIQAGASMRVYNLLGLDHLDCCVAVIKNARSSKFGRKDIIKIEGLPTSIWMFWALLTTILP